MCYERCANAIEIVANTSRHTGPPATGDSSRSAVSCSSRPVLSPAGPLPSFRSSTTSAYVVSRANCPPRRIGNRCEMEDMGLTLLQVLVDGPSSVEELAVPRHAAPLKSLSLTNIVIPKLPRAAGSAALKKQWEAADVDAKWTGSSYAKKMEQASRRKQLNDFERFKVMRLRKQVRWINVQDSDCECVELPLRMNAKQLSQHSERNCACSFIETIADNPDRPASRSARPSPLPRHKQQRSAQCASANHTHHGTSKRLKRIMLRSRWSRPTVWWKGWRIGV